MTNWQWPQWMMFAMLVGTGIWGIVRDIAAPTVQQRWSGLLGTVIAQVVQNIPLYFGGFWK